MYLANIFINVETENEYVIQVWDMDFKQEKIVLFLENEVLLANESLSRIIVNAVYDKYGFRIVTAVIINPAEMAIDVDSFRDLLSEAHENDLLFEVSKDFN